MPPSDWTKDELLTRLHASKRPVTSRQLERWWKAGHMLRPARRHVLGTRGSVSLFAHGAFAQAAALYDAGNARAHGRAVGDRRLDERAFLVWLSGKPLSPPPRSLILSLLTPFMDAIARIRTQKRTKIVPEVGQTKDAAAFDIAEAAFDQYRPEQQRGTLFRTLFANVGRHRDDLISVMVAVMTKALGGKLNFEPSHNDKEPSLALLVLHAFGFADFQSAVTESPEVQIQGALDAVGIFADRNRLTAFVLGLSDEELEISRKCVRAFFEDLPVIFESYGLLFGRHSAARILQAFSRTATTQLRALAVVGMAWTLRREGATAKAKGLLDQIEEALPRAQALCTLAKAFPEHRKLFLPENAKRLAALPDETRKRMFEIVKPAMT